MGYSNYHKSKNPLSPSRLDNAFQASKIEGGPGDPVKVTVDKNIDKGEVTVTKSSMGEKKQLSPEESKAANQRWANMTEAQREAARERARERDFLSSFTYKKIKSEDQFKPQLLDVDMDLKIANPPEEYITKETEKETIETEKGKSKSSKDKSKNKPDKDKSITFTTSGSDGLYSKDLEVSCKMDPDAANRQECKKAKKAKKEAKKSSMYRVKKDGTQKIKKKLMSPGDYFYSKGWRKGRGFGKNLGIVLSPYK